MMSNDEQGLVLAAVKHNRAAFAQLYDRHVNRIYKYLYFKLGSNAEAEDLTAQVFLKAWEAIGGYRWTGRPFLAWLLRIAHNLLTDHFRTQRETVSLDDLPNIFDTNVLDLDSQAEQHFNAQSLHQALHYLTDEQQTVIIFRFLQGYSTDEVAQLMGKDNGAIRALQHRALAALQRRLEQVKD